MKNYKLCTFTILSFYLMCCFELNAQTFEGVTFSSATSSDDNFQPIIGAPYGTFLMGANGSLEISASYGENTFENSPISTKELKIKTSIKVFPNPTTQLINIDLSQLPDGEYDLFLVDFNGKSVYNKTTSDNSEQIDMSLFAVGTYILQVQTINTKKIETFKIIKNQ